MGPPSLIRGWLRVCATLNTVSLSLHGLYSRHRICRVSYVGGWEFVFYTVFIQRSESIESYTCVAEGLRNPSHIQLFFTRSLFIALNLSSLIRGWLRVCFSYGLHSKNWICRVPYEYVGGWGLLQPFSQSTLLYTVFIQSTESAESHTWMAEDLRNPSQSQLFFTRSSYEALNLLSLIRRWVQFAQPFTQLAGLYTVFIQSTGSVESHTWVGAVCATLRTVSYSLHGLYSKY